MESTEPKPSIHISESNWQSKVGDLRQLLAASRARTQKRGREVFSHQEES